MGIKFIVKPPPQGIWEEKFDGSWWDSGRPFQSGNAQFVTGPPDYWKASSGTYGFGLVVDTGTHGNWDDDYRPTKWRMDCNSIANIGEIWLYDSDQNVISHEADYTSLTELDITYQGFDIRWVVCGNFLERIWNIEFYELI